MIFTPTVSHVHARGRANDGDGGEASSSLGWLTLHLFLSVSLLWYLKDTLNRKGHCTLGRTTRSTERVDADVSD